MEANTALLAKIIQEGAKNEGIPFDLKGDHSSEPETTVLLLSLKEKGILVADLGGKLLFFPKVKHFPIFESKDEDSPVQDAAERMRRFSQIKQVWEQGNLEATISAIDLVLEEGFVSRPSSLEKSLLQLKGRHFDLLSNDNLGILESGKVSAMKSKIRLDLYDVWQRVKQHVQSKNETIPPSNSLPLEPVLHTILNSLEGEEHVVRTSHLLLHLLRIEHSYLGYLLDLLKLGLKKRIESALKRFNEESLLGRDRKDQKGLAWLRVLKVFRAAGVLAFDDGFPFITQQHVVHVLLENSLASKTTTQIRQFIDHEVPDGSTRLISHCRSKSYMDFLLSSNTPGKMIF